MKRVLILFILFLLSTLYAIAFLSPSICSNNHILGGRELGLGRTLSFSNNAFLEILILVYDCYIMMPWAARSYFAPLLSKI